MQPFFDVTIQSATNLVTIKMGGFFGEADIANFRHALCMKMQLLACGPNEHLTLCNVAKMDIQAQDIVGAFAKVVGDPRFRSKRLAFVTGSTLARMQTQRLTDREGVAFFTDDAAAKAWLLAP